MSVTSFLELSMVVERQLGPDAARQVDTFLLRAGVNLVAVTVQQGQLARQAFLDYGKGRHSGGHPLLFKGNDFSQTDLVSAHNA
ncbi:MAG: type II toxin-antitoxin system VapC family toxin [Candidatus Eremiobacteraeota bacterium]|nr:type II toxin-antitoxin system VapC family toxin [Candidatus Eremiobacteraeota bacterium]